MTGHRVRIAGDHRVRQWQRVGRFALDDQEAHFFEQRRFVLWLFLEYLVKRLVRLRPPVSGKIDSGESKLRRNESVFSRQQKLEDRNGVLGFFGLEIVV